MEDLVAMGFSQPQARQALLATVSSTAQLTPCMNSDLRRGMHLDL